MEPVLSELKKLSATTVSDALDRLGIAGQCLGIKPLAPEFRLCGRAFTMRTVPVVGEPGSVGDYIDDVPEGEVEETTALVKKVMEGAAHLSIPLIVDAGIGDSWAEAH